MAIADEFDAIAKRMHELHVGESDTASDESGPSLTDMIKLLGQCYGTQAAAQQAQDPALALADMQRAAYIACLAPLTPSGPNIFPIRGT